ncbi:MAG: YdiU family protein [Proteobacteria bacterium]|nr:YdiU family protein [Pseudomonadota bacterium]
MDGFYVPWQAAPATHPRLVKLNRDLARQLGLAEDALDSEIGARIFSGTETPEGAAPVAQVYAGHQFGGFAPRLGDGRALLLGEVIDRDGQRRDIAFKGSGATPFSRGGDGLAALGPVLREYIIGEAMHALRIPTTRALAATTTGEWVYRERRLPGAVLTRVAASHIRVGTFEYFAARGERDQVRRLADYVIARHYPEISAEPHRYARLLEAVCERQAALVAKWMLVGFIHGVMNTDNMTLSGETIDYGPCAFMDRFDPATVFSSIDHGGRYAYGNQPGIATWNLARLADTLLPLFDGFDDTPEPAVEQATDTVKGFLDRYWRHWLTGMREKLGLERAHDDDLELARGFLEVMKKGRTDYTLVFRALADAAEGDEAPLRTHFKDATSIDSWLESWRKRLSLDDVTSEARARSMRAVNPRFIARNHRVEEALEAAVERDDYGPFETLLQVLARPFDEQPDADEYARPSPGHADTYQTFCGT